MAQTYVEYLSEVEFEDILLSDLTDKVLLNLENKQGVSIIGESDIELCLMHKFEPMTILNTVTIFEKVNEFSVVDPFGITIFSGTVDDVIEFTKGFYSNDDI